MKHPVIFIVEIGEGGWAGGGGGGLGGGIWQVRPCPCIASITLLYSYYIRVCHTTKDKANHEGLGRWGRCGVPCICHPPYWLHVTCVIMLDMQPQNGGCTLSSAYGGKQQGTEYRSEGC